MIVSFDMTSPSVVSVTRTHSARAVGAACACILLSWAASSAAAQAGSPPLSKVEQKIRDYVRAHEAEQVGFLEKAVNISSGTFNLAGVRAVGRLFEPEFSSLGFQANWIALPDAVPSYVSDYLDALDGLGVKGMRSHTPDERVDLRSIVPATERAAILIYRLTRSH